MAESARFRILGVSGLATGVTLGLTMGHFLITAVVGSLQSSEVCSPSVIAVDTADKASNDCVTIGSADHYEVVALPAESAAMFSLAFATPRSRERFVPVRVPLEVANALKNSTHTDPGHDQRNVEVHQKRVELVKSMIGQCRRNGCLPERAPFIMASMAIFQISWDEVDSSPQEMRDMWFECLLHFLRRARHGSHWHFQEFQRYMNAAPSYVTLQALGTSQDEVDRLRDHFDGPHRSVTL